MKRIIIVSALFWIISLCSQSQPIQRVEPPSWWTGMKDPLVQVMIYGKDISMYNLSIEYPGLSISTITKTENPNYLFVNLNLSDCKPGSPVFVFTRGKEKVEYTYTLLPKSTEPQRGLNSSDVIYLLMPDRFANGDPSNDNIEGMYEKADRDNPGGRHGGDLKGISDHLPYLRDLGVTGIWINPFLENNQKTSSYHGYSITNFYRVDPRFGSNDEFRDLVNKAHGSGLKVVMDMIINHCGSEHWWMKDLPSKDWIHQFNEFTRSNYRASTIMDPYAATCDEELMEKGWFDATMPDLNQSNPLLETYLIQNSLWWIGFSGLDGIRMDTYPYPEKNMMSRWAKRLTDEYPGFFIVGEAWYQQEALTAYWSLDKENPDGYRSNLPSVTDFPVSLSTHQAFTEPDSWTEGVARLYTVLTQDFLYPNPNTNVIFLDNHDMTRFFTETGRDVNVYKMALSFIFTTRGIPQFYYGTEIIMEGDKNKGDGNLRCDFPGGWQGDKRDCFTIGGLTPAEKEAFLFTRGLLNWRKNSQVIQTGKLKHYIPENNLYVYFRYNDNESVMVILNNSNNESKQLFKSRYLESMEGFTSGHEIISGTDIPDLTSFTIAPKSAMIIELKK